MRSPRSCSQHTHPASSAMAAARAALCGHPSSQAAELCLLVLAAEDLISAVQFDGSGDYLATGDRGGRVVIFESSEVQHRTQQRDRTESERMDIAPRQDIEYRFYCEFQSHEPEFDYLKSLEIEEKINRIRWRHGRAGPLFLLSTNGAHRRRCVQRTRIRGCCCCFRCRCRRRCRLCRCRCRLCRCSCRLCRCCCCRHRRRSRRCCRCCLHILRAVRELRPADTRRRRRAQTRRSSFGRSSRRGCGWSR